MYYLIFIEANRVEILLMSNCQLNLVKYLEIILQIINQAIKLNSA